MSEKNYTVYHLHDETSLLDSCTNFKLYIEKAKELGQTALCFSNHGTIYSWVDKKIHCEKAGIKYIHGVEIYLTESLNEKIRDNYHTVLIAKNYEGVKEINLIIDKSTQEDHMYYKPRISFDEFFNISNNVIKISACLASPLNNCRESERYDELCKAYDFYEVQPHINSKEQKDYNAYLIELAKKYDKPLIVGTDTHSLDKYKAECRKILKEAKHMLYENEDDFDMTYKTYDELIEMFKEQGVLSESTVIEALENTNKVADMVESFELDLSFKYPVLHNDEETVIKALINSKYKNKIRENIIEHDQCYVDSILEEFRVFKKIGMLGFMLFMSELATYCWDNNIPLGYCRGSVGGSTIAYILDITDVNPIIWNTVFSRFANEDRIEIGDIDIDVSPSQRQLVYDYIINRFGQDNTSYILAIGTISDKGTIDTIGRALSEEWIKDKNDVGIVRLEKILEALKNKENKSANDLYGEWEVETLLNKRFRDIQDSKNNPYSLTNISLIKKEYESDPIKARKKYPDLFYYFDGMINTAVSQSMHPAGIIASPVSLPDNYGTFWSEGKRIITLNMEEVHEVSLVKYDILGLKNVEIAKDTCEMIGKTYPKSHEIDWEDSKVWDDIISSNVGIFQFEGNYAYDLMKRYKPRQVNDLSLLNASLRPSGASYRDRLIAREFNKNPSEQIDELLKDNNGYLVFQEDTIKFLQRICGLSGSEADNVRRAIGRKQRDRLEAALPRILEGYCAKSEHERFVAEEEAKSFLQIIEDSSEYQFGFNHSTGYSMIGYLCAFLRYHHPLEFITSYLNNAGNESDITSGTELAHLKGIDIKPIKFRYSQSKYFPDKETNSIYKGLSSVKFLSDDVSLKLYDLRFNTYDTFVNFLKINPCDSRQTEILINLGFFSEFGKTYKLMEIYKLFGKIYGKKQFNQNNCPVPIEIIEKYSDKTDKMYKNFDSMAILTEMCEMIEDRDLPLDILLKNQIEFLGYIDYINPSLKNEIIVCDLNTKYSPKMEVYHLDTGKTETLKVATKVYGKNPFSKGDILKTKSIIRKNKATMLDGKWCKSLSEFDRWVESYEICN